MDVLFKQVSSRKPLIHSLSQTRITFKFFSNLADVNFNNNQISEIDTDFVVSSLMGKEMVVRVQNNVCVNKTVGITIGRSYAILSELSNECRRNIEDNKSFN